jgi:hypothetical protein
MSNKIDPVGLVGARWFEGAVSGVIGDSTESSGLPPYSISADQVLQLTDAVEQQLRYTWKDGEVKLVVNAIVERAAQRLRILEEEYAAEMAEDMHRQLDGSEDEDETASYETLPLRTSTGRGRQRSTRRSSLRVRQRDLVS